MSYPRPAAFTQVEIVIKKSRFIAWADCAPDRASALQLLEKAKHQFPDARHHCWAYLLGNPLSAASSAISDDGEPSGTAGKPILNVLQHKGVGDIMLVVTRYFGGIKLGAGGLVRAYSAAAQQCMESLLTEIQIAMQAFTLTCDFSQEQAVRHWLNKSGGSLDTCEYRQQVHMAILLPETGIEDFTRITLDSGWQLTKTDAV